MQDYSKLNNFYGLLTGVSNVIATKDDNLNQAKSYILQLKGDEYAELYAALSAETKAELDAIEVM